MALKMKVECQQAAGYSVTGDNKQAGRLRSPVNAGRQDAGPERITTAITGRREFASHTD